jgi:type I restriction enzyme S subunit
MIEVNHKIQRYESYKNSGIEWLGEIPEHWGIESFKHILTERNEKNAPIKTKEILSLSIDKGVTLYAEKTTNLDRFKDDFSKYKLAHKGDLVFNSMNMIVGAVGVSDYFGCVSPVYYTYYGEELNNSDTSKFYEYLFRSKIVQGVLYSLGKGLMAIDRGDGKYNTLRLKVSRDDLRSMKLPFPNPSEQTQIVQFLNDKTTKIDEAIAIKEQQIGLLKERKQILIHKAVTRGLDDNVKLKDSGVEWIDEVPEGWEVKRLKFACKLISEKLLSKESQLKYIGMENIESWSGKFISSDSETDGLASYFQKGDVLFGKLRPYLAKVYLAQDEGICSTEFLVYRTGEIIFNWYLNLILRSFEFINLIDSSTYGSKMPRANSEFIGNQLIPIPPLSEQKEISAYIETASRKIETAISLKQQEIAKLKEYKSSLINGVVTGKVKVC